MRKERVIYDNYDLEEMNCDYWEDERELLKEFFDGSEQYLVRGYVGRWNGSYAAGQVFNDFDEMFYTAAQDCDYWKIWDENGHLYLKCSHHDGTNLFEIKRLTQRGAAFLDKWENDFGDIRTMKEIHGIIWDSNFFSGLPHYAHTVYGCKKQEAQTV